MPKIISDDVGSFPLPEEIEREETERIALRLISEKLSDEDDKRKFSKVVIGIMKKKIEAGLKKPNYPQFRDMRESFFKLIDNFQQESQPFLIDGKFAKILELDFLDALAKKYYEEKKEALELRVCVTGPLELYIKKFGNLIEGDLLRNLAKSVSRFFENSLINKKYFRTKVLCLDEPSLGLNPNLNIDEEDLIKALEISTGKVGKVDMQIHLHSPLEIDKVLQVESIGIIGVESAENPSVLEEIDKEELESYDKFLRIGIARSNIFGLANDYNEKFKRDVWREKNFLDLVEKMEPEKKIEKRLKLAWKKFAERIKYAGPDCGLRAWPTQESAFQLLKNSVKAIEDFNS